MGIKEASLTKIDFNNLKPEDVFSWLEQFGFWRYVSEQYIIPNKSVDPRLIKPDESPAGLYLGIIVPQFNLHEAVFVIRSDLFHKIKNAYHDSTTTHSHDETHKAFPHDEPHGLS